MERFLEKINQLLGSFYGADRLNKHLALVAIFLFIVSQIFSSSLFMIVSILLYILLIFRIFSKNFSKRFAENQKYLELLVRIGSTSKDIRTVYERSRSVKKVKCPNCKKKIEGSEIRKF